MGDTTFRRGFAQLAQLGLSFDAWLYHPQIGELTALARVYLETRIVLNHVEAARDRRLYRQAHEEVFGYWRAAVRDLASCRSWWRSNSVA